MSQREVMERGDIVVQDSIGFDEDVERLVFLSFGINWIGSGHWDWNFLRSMNSCFGGIMLILGLLEGLEVEALVDAREVMMIRTSKGGSTETSDRLAAIQAQLNNLGREIKKVNEKVYAAQVGCEQWGYRATAPGYYQRNNANPLFQERRQSMEDTLSKFMSESAKRHEENFNLIKEIRASTDAAIRNQGASIKTLEIQIGQMSKVLQKRGFRILPSSTKTNPKDQVKSISTFIKVDSNLIRRIGSNQYAVSTRQNKLRSNKSKGALINVPIFVGTFSVVTDFAVLEDMDAYRDEGMGDASKEDKMKGISHPYQKLKGFYKGVLNLGSNYIRDAKIKEWLTRRNGERRS
ncbi:hypothetical protein Tco_0396042 [Tanacetum coccineum]